VPTQQQAEAEHVGPAAVQDKQRVGRTPEDTAQQGAGSVRPCIGPIGNGITGVGLGDGTDDVWMDTSMVVTAEALARRELYRGNAHGQ
jgi:hypothetical protein